MAFNPKRVFVLRYDCNDFKLRLFSYVIPCSSVVSRSNSDLSVQYQLYVVAVVVVVVVVAVVAVVVGKTSILLSC